MLVIVTKTRTNYFAEKMRQTVVQFCLYSLSPGVCTSLLHKCKHIGLNFNKELMADIILQSVRSWFVMCDLLTSMIDIKDGI